MAVATATEAATVTEMVAVTATTKTLMPTMVH
jgi:hypothetical protein